MHDYYHVVITTLTTITTNILITTITTITLIITDGVQRGLVGEIISRFERKGFKLVCIRRS